MKTFNILVLIACAFTLLVFLPSDDDVSSQEIERSTYRIREYVGKSTMSDEKYTEVLEDLNEADAVYDPLSGGEGTDDEDNNVYDEEGGHVYTRTPSLAKPGFSVGKDAVSVIDESVINTSVAIAEQESGPASEPESTPTSGKREYGYAGHQPAKDMNSEIYEMVKTYCDMLPSNEGINQSAIASYMFGGSEVEQSAVRPKSDADTYIIPVTPWGEAEYEKTPEIVKAFSTTDSLGYPDQHSNNDWGRLHWAIDSFESRPYGPLSLYWQNIVAPSIREDIPDVDRLGTSMGAVSPSRTITAKDWQGVTQTATGDSSNWYDSVQVTAGIYANAVKLSGADVKAPYNGRTFDEHYFQIAWMGQGMSIGIDIYSQAKSKKVYQESMTRDFAMRWAYACTEKWVIDEINDYISANQPRRFGYGDKHDFWLAGLCVKIAAKCLQEDANFFNGYTSSGKCWYVTLNGSYEDALSSGDVWVSATTTGVTSGGGVIRISQAIKTVYCAILAEHRFAGEY